MSGAARRAQRHLGVRKIGIVAQQITAENTREELDIALVWVRRSAAGVATAQDGSAGNPERCLAVARSDPGALVGLIHALRDANLNRFLDEFSENQGIL